MAVNPGGRYAGLRRVGALRLRRPGRWATPGGVVKQADLVLALHLRGDACSQKQKRNNFAYYKPLTVRDSSLSACTQVVIAAEVRHLELAYDCVGYRDRRSTSPTTVGRSPSPQPSR